MQINENYGGRGIKNRFKREQFVRHCLELLDGRDVKRLDIDRIDNDGHYEPGNIRLVPRHVNLRNKRSNVFVTYQGMRIVAADLAKQIRTDRPWFSLTDSAVAKLAAKGEPVEGILNRCNTTRQALLRHIYRSKVRYR
jgi:hypothetical protein